MFPPHDATADDDVVVTTRAVVLEEFTQRQTHEQLSYIRRKE